MKQLFGIGIGIITSIAAQAYANINLSQSINDINGGSVEIGDMLEYTITATNDTSETLSNAQLSDIIPLGSQYVANSIQTTGGGSYSIDSTHADTINYSQQSFAPGDTITITYQVVVEDSPLYFVDNIDFYLNMFLVCIYEECNLS